MPRKLIMCGDHPVLAFEYDPESGRACSSGEVLDHDRLPLEFTTHGKSALYAKRIDEWWRSRAIPSTRDGIRRVLESLGASSTGELLDRTYGLSLSDQYWVKREDDPVEWKDINFFDNPFDEALGEILLTSYSSSHDISLNAPDVSTGGDLPKRWTIDRATGRRLLVKSGRRSEAPRKGGPYGPGADERGHRLEALRAAGRSRRPVFAGAQRQPLGLHVRGHAHQP